MTLDEQDVVFGAIGRLHVTINSLASGPVDGLLLGGTVWVINDVLTLLEQLLEGEKNGKNITVQ